MQVPHQSRDKYRALLQGKTRDELNLIAKYLNVSGFRKLGRDLLIQTILDQTPESNLERLLTPSWWTRYHNHVYGVAGLIGLALTVLFFLWPRFQSRPNNSNPVKQEIPATSDADGKSTKGSNSDAEEAKIASDATAFSPISFEDFISRRANGTDLQKDALEEELRTKTVIWNGTIISIRSGENGAVRVGVIPSAHSFEVAFLDFDGAQKSEFLKLKEGQVIRFSGVYQRYYLGPNLEKCRLLRVIG